MTHVESEAKKLYETRRAFTNNTESIIIIYESSRVHSLLNLWKELVGWLGCARAAPRHARARKRARKRARTQTDSSFSRSHTPPALVLFDAVAVRGQTTHAGRTGRTGPTQETVAPASHGFGPEGHAVTRGQKGEGAHVGSVARVVGCSLGPRTQTST